jgi:primase-polymerase (primpol)-like protein
MDSISLDEIKKRSQWLVWRYEPGTGDKPIKVPYSSKTGCKTGSDDSHRSGWTTYVEAQACVASGNFTGVGIVLTDGLNGIDIDHRELDDDVTHDILSMVKSYSEYSPSGKGLHILFNIDTERLPAGFVATYKDRYYQNKPSDPKLECYLTSAGAGSKFFTFTESVVVNQPINDCTEGVFGFLNNYMRKHKKNTVAACFQQSNRPRAPYEPKQGQSDNQVMELCSCYDGATSSLLAGRWHELGYSSQSEADLAFAQRLVYWSGGDIVQADGIFRWSGLMRSKWDEQHGAQTYGQMTLEKALQSNYPPRSIKEALRRDWLTSLKLAREANL